MALRWTSPRSRKSRKPADRPAHQGRRQPFHLTPTATHSERIPMLRSMFSAVSGLRSHQTMMDVIGNNIANVNTTGYKASAAEFEDLLSQMLKGAGGPQNGLGGSNPAQIGIGTKIGAITTSFTQ